MSLCVWSSANSLLYPENGRHLWAYRDGSLAPSPAGYDVRLEGTELDLSIGDHMVQPVVI